jgi:hypothetical protein
MVVIEMAGKYQINAEQKAELQSARRENKDKRVDTRLKALILRAEGNEYKWIGEVCEYHPSYVSQLVSKYSNHGLGAIVDNHYTGNRRNMSLIEEAALLEPFKERAAAGQIVDVSEILAAYESKLGRTVNSNGQIYSVLKRHDWRKVMPRSKHPNKASDEEVDASKKLTPLSII